MKDVSTYDARSPPWLKWLESTNQAASMLAQNAAEEAKAAGSIMMSSTAMEGTEGASDDLAAEAEAAQQEAARQAASQEEEGGAAEGDEGEQQVRSPFVALVLQKRQDVLEFAADALWLATGLIASKPAGSL